MKPLRTLARVGAAHTRPSLIACATVFALATFAGAAPPAEKSGKPPESAPPPAARPPEPRKPALEPRDGPTIAKPREVTPREIAPVDRPTVTKPREEPPREVKPREVKPREVKPREVAPVDRPTVTKPREEPPREVKPREVKPREVAPREERPIDRPVTPPVTRPTKPSEPIRPEPRRPLPEDPAIKRPIVAPERDDKPIARPITKPPTRPDPAPSPTGRPGIAIIEPSKPREDRAERPLPKRPSNPPLVESGRVIEDRPERIQPPFTRETVHGVPVARTDARGSGRNDRDDDDDDRACHDRYIRNVARCNGWWYGSRWSDCGPCHVWQPYHCRDGIRISVGFGSGFNFGFFYGTSCAPLCSSWCNPWWDGHATYWSCRPSWSWSTAWCRPWHHYWTACAPCPLPAWTPCYAYSPVVYRPVVVAAPQPVVPNPDAMWAFLADGYDRDAEDGFILLEAADPSDQRWVLGQAIARAFRGDSVRAATLLRSAFVHDPSAIAGLSRDPKFIARLEALERSLDPLVQAARPSIDALVIAAASQAARGALSESYLNATTAVAEGDRSTGAANLAAWLRAELRRVP